MNQDYQVAQDALRYIDPHDRGTWVQMGMAVKSGLGDAGYDLWDEWSRNADNYKERDARAVWKSLKEGGGIGLGSLIHEARQKGYKPAAPYKAPSAEEIARIKRERAERDAQEQAEKRRLQLEAQKRAKDLIAGRPHAQTHPYLSRKKVRGYKIFQLKDGKLGIPMRDERGELWSVQTIDAEGNKLFLKDGRARGLYFTIGQYQGRIVIAEGYATGASIHEATGYAVAVAFSAGNLSGVATALRVKYSSAELIIAGDLGNGSDDAREAAQVVKGKLAFPVLGSGKDFNDVHAGLGLEAVKEQIDAAQPAEKQQPEKAADVQALDGPEPLPDLPPVMPLNFDALPPVMRAYVEDIADRMQCPPDFPAVSCIAMIGSAIGRKIGLRPKREDNWTVPPNIWAMIVGKSGIMKSPAMSAALSPLRKLQADAFQRHEMAMQEHQTKSQIAKFALEDAAGVARKFVKDGLKAKANEVLSNANAEIEKEPTPRRFIINDSTVEALAETLEENPNGILVDRDELSGWLRSLDKDGQQEARAFYLTAADGDKGFTTDRIGRGRGKHIAAVTVSIIGGIQPGVLAAYVRETQRGGAGDDGLLQRFGVTVYPDITAEWKNVDRKPNAEARKAMDDLVTRLCDLDPFTIGAEQDPYQPIPFLRFSSEAQAMFDEWRAELEARIRSDDEHPAIISHLAKYRKLIPSLALINHLCGSGQGPITEESLARALTLGEYLESHARRVYSYASRPDVDAARSLIGKIRGGKLKLPFKAQHVYRAGWSGLSATEEAYAALRLLQDHGYLFEVQDSREPADRGGRPSKPLYDAHPSIRPSR